MVAEFSGEDVSILVGIGRGKTYLGLMRWVIVKMTPSTTQIPATTTYAIPRKGFFPPTMVRVESMIFFFPPYTLTGKSTLFISNRSQRDMQRGTDSW